MEAQKAKQEESLGLHALESYSAISLRSFAQWNCRWLSDHAILGSNPLNCGMPLMKRSILVFVIHDKYI